MSDAQTSRMRALDAFLETQRDEAQRLQREAFESLDAAAGELEQIRSELARAFAGETYVDVGEIHGIDAQAIFSAFGVVRRMAELEVAHAEQEVASARQRFCDRRRRIARRPHDGYLKEWVEQAEIDTGAKGRAGEHLQQGPALQQAQLEVSAYTREPLTEAGVEQLRQEPDLSAEGMATLSAPTQSNMHPRQRIAKAAARDAERMHERAQERAVVEHAPPPPEL